MRCVDWPGLLLHVLCVYRHVVINVPQPSKLGVPVLYLVHFVPLDRYFLKSLHSDTAFLWKSGCDIVTLSRVFLHHLHFKGKVTHVSIE